MRTHAVVCLLLFVLPCVAPRSVSAAPRHSLDFDVVYSGGIGNFDSSLFGDHVFRNESSWCAFWNEAFGDVSPPPACPAVDFRHHAVIASAGMECGCNRFRIESVERAGSRRAVEVLVRSFFPGPFENCICVASCWVTAHAIAVAKPVGAVEFVHEDVEFSCSR